MLTPSPALPAHRDARLCRLTAGLLILAAAVLRLIYLAGSHRLDLAPDEAHYWDWSRRLDWSYYSKGPLVAWLIRASTELFGGLSLALTGSEMPAVRLPAVVCSSLLLVALYVLTVRTLRSERLALGLVAAALTVPVISAGASLMTIDAPYICCWAWALVLAHWAIFGNHRWAWPAAGLVTALGILAKHNMAAFVPSVGLFLLFSREHRRLLLRPGFWSMAAVSLLGVLPILVWNAQHDWMTFKHVIGHTGPGKPLTWVGPFAYLGGQLALLMGVWFVAWVGAMIVHRPWREPDADKRYLWWTSLPMFGVFLAFSPRTGVGELNWPVAAYVSGMVLAAGWIADCAASPQRWQRRLAVGSVAGVCLLGLSLTLFIHRSDLARPVLLTVSGAVKPDRPYPLRRFDPTCRLRGWQTLAAEVDAIRAELRQRGIEAELAATIWSLPGEIAFYCEGHPVVYNVGRLQGDRWSQYDLWRPNPIADPERFRGRTFIIVGGVSPMLAKGFRRIEPARHVRYTENGDPIAGWDVFVCHDFQGFGPIPDAAH